MNEESGSLDGEAIEPAESLYEGCRISFRTWPDTESAQRLGDYVIGYTRALSRHLDLSRLEAIVIGMDYHEALASVARPGEDLGAVPTSNEYGQGGAMTLPVPHGDELWSAVVLWGAFVIPLPDELHEYHAIGLYTLAHELVHANDMQLFANTYPGGWKAAHVHDPREAALLAMVKPCQSEYSASRRSAWAFPEHGLSYLDMLGAALADVDAQIRAARYAYRRHHDVSGFWRLVQARLEFLFKALGYALGHADWVAHAEDLSPGLAEPFEVKLTEMRQLPSGWVIDACRLAVARFHRLEAFTGLELYDDLKAVGERLLHQYGVFPSVAGDQVYLDIPRRRPWFDLSTAVRGKRFTRTPPGGGTR
jgi:hypothetical protein